MHISVSTCTHCIFVCTCIPDVYAYVYPVVIARAVNNWSNTLLTGRA